MRELRAPGTAGRIPEQGRIRMGVKAGKAMKSIPTFRLTSADEVAIKKAAELYGGRARPWAGAPVAGEWEVTTEAKRLPIVLPPDPLSIHYELWSKGGCQRRCDTVTCLTPQSTADGFEMAEEPCICKARGQRSCDPHTRLKVILPELPFGGVWRLDTKGWTAFDELPGMVEALQSMTGNGVLVRAFLVNEAEQRVSNGQTKNYQVPRIRWEQSFDQIMQGGAQVRALAAAEAQPGRAALPPAPVHHDDDDEFAEAEIVVDRDMTMAVLRDALAASVIEGWEASALYDAFVARYPELDGEELEARIISVTHRIVAGELVFKGVNAAGVAQVVKA